MRTIEQYSLMLRAMAARLTRERRRRRRVEFHLEETGRAWDALDATTQKVAGLLQAMATSGDLNRYTIQDCADALYGRRASGDEVTITWPSVGDRVRMIGTPPGRPLTGTVIEVRRKLVRVRWDEAGPQRKRDTTDVAPQFLLALNEAHPCRDMRTDRIEHSPVCARCGVDVDAEPVPVQPDAEAIERAARVARDAYLSVDGPLDGSTQRDEAWRRVARAVAAELGLPTGETQ